LQATIASAQVKAIAVRIDRDHTSPAPEVTSRSPFAAPLTPPGAVVPSGP
jgi:hypothetical protein